MNGHRGLKRTGGGAVANDWHIRRGRCNANHCRDARHHKPSSEENSHDVPYASKHLCLRGAFGQPGQSTNHEKTAQQDDSVCRWQQQKGTPEVKHIKKEVQDKEPCGQSRDEQ